MTSGSVESEIMIGWGDEGKFNYLIATICILILRDNGKHVLTKYLGEQSLDACAILSRLSRCKYTQLVYD